MKLRILAMAAALLPVVLFAQRHQIGEINTETEEGKVLQAIGTEEDAARKVQLMEGFVAKFPKHDAAGWVWSQLQPAYAKAAAFDKALTAGETLLALDPQDLHAAYGNLKAAESKKDAAAVLKWAVVSSDIARKATGAPVASDGDGEEHKRSVEFAKQVDTYSDYALSAGALTSNDPKLVLQIVETMDQRSPNSQYLGQVLGKYAWAARETKSMPSAIVLGERALARNQAHEDLLLAMADYQVNQPKPDADKVGQYTDQLVQLISSKPKPDGVSDADWDKRKSTLIGVGHWMAGTAYGAATKYPQADKSLRAALPYIKDNDQMMAGALFHLGVANYTMGKGKSAQMLADAVKFMQQCVAIKSPFQAQAQKNLAVMRKETGGK